MYLYKHSWISCNDEDHINDHDHHDDDDQHGDYDHDLFLSNL